MLAYSMAHPLPALQLLKNAIYYSCAGNDQAAEGKIKAIPDDEDFAVLRRAGAGSEEADLALAITIQEEELISHQGPITAAQRAQRCVCLRAKAISPETAMDH
jgi:hypothetical protein